MRKILLVMIMVCAVCASAQEITEQHAFKAMLNGKIAIEVAFQTTNDDGNWQTAGYIYYPKAKSPAPILIVDNWNGETPAVSEDDNVFNRRFMEFQTDGENTGMLYLTYAEVEGDFQILKGYWKHPTTGKVMHLTNIEDMREFPTWWPGSPEVSSNPDRTAWKFLYKLEDKYDNTGDSEWMNSISVTFEVNGEKHPLSFEEPLVGSVNSEMEEKLDWIIEKDINFDGIPDLMVYLGVTHNAQSVFKAFVWNPVTRQFYDVAAFQDIQEPDFDYEEKTITSVARDGMTFYIDTYKWKNGKLTLIKSKTESLAD